MKSRRQDLSEDGQITSRRDKRLKTSVNGSENLDSIPIELVIDILSRLPAKFIAKYRCVSKRWVSLLRRPDFTELFMTRSRARPQLLFACYNKQGELFFYSSPQLQNPDENSSSIIASYLMKTPFIQWGNVWHINGLVLVRDARFSAGKTNSASVSVCNPSTGQSLALPEIKKGFYSYLGYDPIEKQFKVLSMTNPIGSGLVPQEFQVLTLGLGGRRNMSWRKVEYCLPHYLACSDVICANGAFYFEPRSSKVKMIVCFDIRYEKFRFIKVGDDITGPNHDQATLINFNGKLGSIVVVEPDSYVSCFTERSTSFVLWVLEDTEKHEWSKHVYVFPPMWKNVVGDMILECLGVIGENEFVFKPFGCTSSFYLFYYNSERNTVRRVEIQGLEAPKVFTFLNHVEDIRQAY